MPVKPETLAALAAPFAPGLIQYRAGYANKEKTSALALAYIDARTVASRLDTVLGIENWKNDFYWEKIGDNVICLCTITVHIWNADGKTSNWVSKQDGAASTQLEAVKGGISDSFKRAAVQWGLGRSLYFLPSEWVQCHLRGRSVQLTQVPVLPGWYTGGLPHAPSLDESAPQAEVIYEVGPTNAGTPAQVMAPAVVAPAPVAPAPIVGTTFQPPPSFPAAINAATSIGFGKKVLSNGRAIREYTWGEIAELPADDEARSYVEWMARACQENLDKGKDPGNPMKLAKQMVDWLMRTSAEQTTAEMEAQAPIDNPFAPENLEDGPYVPF